MQYFEKLMDLFPREMALVFSQISSEDASRILEIRFRENKPVALTVKNGIVYLQENGELTRSITKHTAVIRKEQMEDLFFRLCNHSVYAREQELREGYLSLPNGGRAGVCGTVSPDGMMRKITSVNIRIAREIRGCADFLFQRYDGKGLLIAGPPGCGKTTVLRDFIRQLSLEYRVAVIDSRHELSTRFSNDWLNADVLLTHDKAKGMEMALRTLFPQFIAFDEIGTTAELNGVRECLNTGVSVVTTVHIGEVEELFQRPLTRDLLQSSAIKTVAVLKKKIGEQPTLYTIEELRRLENDRHRTACSVGLGNRL